VGPETGGAGGAAPEPPLNAGAGAGGAPEQPIVGLYVGVDGSDSASGTLTEPFLTLAHAASVATAGETIVLLDGEHALGALASRITLVDGVDLIALHPGAATLVTKQASNLLELSGRHHIAGIGFDGFQNVVHFTGGATATGELRIDDSSFVRCASVCIEVSGSTSVEIQSAHEALLGNGTGKFLVASDTSRVSIDGGVLRNYSRKVASRDAAIEVFGSALVELSDLRIDDGVAQAITASDQATVNAKQVTIATVGRDVVWLAGNAEVSFLDSDLSLKPSVVAPGNCFTQTMDNQGSLWLERTQGHGCQNGIYGSIPGSLRIIDSELYGHEVYGMDGQGSGGDVKISGSKLYQVGFAALRLGPSSSNIELEVRNSQFTGPTTSATGTTAVEVQATATSTLDFGTGATPGGNKLIGNNAQNPGLRVHSSLGGLVTAVGNEWTASQQGADALGHYAVLVGSTLDIHGPSAVGPNHGVSFAGATLRLAETAP
jgi:hypothetical protein